MRRHRARSRTAEPILVRVRVPYLPLVAGRFGATARMMGASAVLFVAPAVAAQAPLVMLPLGDPAYVQLDGLARQGCAAARVSAYRPYLVQDVRRALGEAGSEHRCHGGILSALSDRFLGAGGRPAVLEDMPGEDRGAAARSPDTADADGDVLRAGAALTLRATALDNGEFRPLWLDVRDPGEGDPPAVAVLRGRVTWGRDSRLAAVAEAYGQTSRRNDPLIRAAPFRRTSGVLDFSAAYLNGGLGPLVLSVGREREAWLGDREESLVLSAHGPPLDRVLIAGRWRRLEARALFGTLDDVVLSSANGEVPAGVPPQRLYRYLAAHALTWTPIPAIELTIGETVLFSRGSRTVDLGYANPLMVYLVTQNDRSREDVGERDNLAAFGAARLLAGGATFAGELLVDDIQIDARDRDVIPDQLGMRFGVTVPLQLLVPASVGIDYRRIGSYTYLRGFYSEVYQQYDRPLGSELGPAADELIGRAEVWLGGRWRVSGRAELWRRGGLRIDERPARRALGHAGEPFPAVTDIRPVVQRAARGELKAELLSSRIPIVLRLEGARVDDVNNQPANPTLLLRAAVSATFAVRYP